MVIVLRLFFPMLQTYLCASRKPQNMADMAIFSDILSIFPCIEHGVIVGVGSGSWHRPRSKSRSFFRKSVYQPYDAVSSLYCLALPLKAVLSSGLCGKEGGPYL